MRKQKSKLNLPANRRCLHRLFGGAYAALQMS